MTDHKMTKQRRRRAAERGHPVLSVRQAEARMNEEERNEEIVKLLHWVKSRVTALGTPEFLRQDAYQCACLELLAAAGRYDSGRGTTFKTFAGFRVDGAIRDCMRRQATYSHPMGEPLFEFDEDSDDSLEARHGEWSAIMAIIDLGCLRGACHQDNQTVDEWIAGYSLSECAERNGVAEWRISRQRGVAQRAMAAAARVRR